MFKEVLFDLDGTITFSHPGICAGVKFALGKMGVVENDMEKLKSFVGPPLRGSFMSNYGFSLDEAEKCIEFYREYYSVKGIFEFDVVPGIKELIKDLYNNGVRVFLATSKPQAFARQITDRIGITQYFTEIVGCFMDGTREKKEEVIAYIKANYGLENPIMIGDTFFDVQGAQKNGIKTVLVTYGYGTNLDKLDKNISFVADSVDELRDFVI